MVDLDGTVTAVVPRSQMRAERLRHRCTYVAVVVGASGSLGPVAEAGVLSPEHEVIVHQRADWKDTYPSYWDLAFGGVCSVGEDWEPSAARELAEEAGIEGAPLLDLGHSAFEDASNRVLGRVFLTSWPDDPVCNDGEVVAIDRVPLAQLEAWAQERPVCPDSHAVVVPRLLGLLA